MLYRSPSWDEFHNSIEDRNITGIEKVEPVVSATSEKLSCTLTVVSKKNIAEV
jgi:hypothetical protein